MRANLDWIDACIARHAQQMSGAVVGAASG
jgi:hypothetical protein